LQNFEATADYLYVSVKEFLLNEYKNTDFVRQLSFKSYRFAAPTGPYCKFTWIESVAPSYAMSGFKSSCNDGTAGLMLSTALIAEF
jgi:hypothetical protein